MKFLISKTAFRILVVATLMGLPFRSLAGYEMFLSFAGVSGDATNGLIAINSLQWGIGRGVSLNPREASPPSISEATISKMMDSASPMLAMLAANGMGTNTCIVTIKDQASGLALYTLTLTGVYISGYSVSTGGDVPSESLSLNFTKITWVYQKIDNGKAAGPPSPAMGWDLAKQAPLP